MHLSKIKHSKFNESAQLLVFYVASAVVGINIVYTVSLSQNFFVVKSTVSMCILAILPSERMLNITNSTSSPIVIITIIVFVLFRRSLFAARRI